MRIGQDAGDKAQILAARGADGWGLPDRELRQPLALTMGGAVLAIFGLGYTAALGMAALTSMAALNWSFYRLVSYAAGPVVADLPTVAALLYAVLVVACVPLAMRLFRRRQVA